MADVKDVRAAILGMRGKVPIEEYEIKGAGVIYIHGFTGQEKANWQKECRKKNGEIDSTLVEPLMFQMCVRDAKGKHLYKFADVPKLMELPAAILGEVTDVCMRLSGMGENADEAIVKNLRQVEDGDS